MRNQISAVNPINGKQISRTTFFLLIPTIRPLRGQVLKNQFFIFFILSDTLNSHFVTSQKYLYKKETILSIHSNTIEIVSYINKNTYFFLYTSSIPLFCPKLRLYCLSVGLFQCSNTPRLCTPVPSCSGS